MLKKIASHTYLLIFRVPAASSLTLLTSNGKSSTARSRDCLIDLSFGRHGTLDPLAFASLLDRPTTTDRAIDASASTGLLAGGLTSLIIIVFAHDKQLYICMRKSSEVKWKN